jgi:GNAT superfamily N-acetyltransferase
VAAGLSRSGLSGWPGLSGGQDRGRSGTIDGVAEGVRVRGAVPDDAAAIATIRVAGWRAAYAGLIEQAVLDALDPVTEAVRRRAEWAERPTPVVAEVDGRVVGFVLTCPYRTAIEAPAHWPHDPDAGEVAALYVDPAVHGRGVGRALMDRALADLRAAGHPVAHLWVLTGNARARRFYEAAGFVDESPVGVTHDWIAPGATRPTPEVRYSRRLD